MIFDLMGENYGYKIKEAIDSRAELSFKGILLISNKLIKLYQRLIHRHFLKIFLIT